MNSMISDTAKTTDLIECGYCNREIPVLFAEDVPEVDDDQAWASIAAQHEADCEWCVTRAHRVETVEEKLERQVWERSLQY